MKSSLIINVIKSGLAILTIGFIATFILFKADNGFYVSRVDSSNTVVQAISKKFIEISTKYKKDLSVFGDEDILSQILLDNKGGDSWTIRLDFACSLRSHLDSAYVDKYVGKILLDGIALNNEDYVNFAFGLASYFNFTSLSRISLDHPSVDKKNIHDLLSFSKYKSDSEITKIINDVVGDPGLLENYALDPC